MADIGAPQIITVDQAMSYAAQAGFNNTKVPGTNYTQLQVVVGIASAESGLDIHAWNPNDPFGGSYGILQINAVHFLNGATSQSAVLTPQGAFQYAHVLSGGVNFNPWSTFTSGAYKAYIPNIPGQGTTPVSILPKDGWWNFPRVDKLGSPDVFGGFPKPDSNIQVPDDYPVATILSGTVSGINNPNGSIDPWGAAVTLRLDKPLNTLATHIAYLHLSRVTVRQGQHVNVGDLVGYNGGNHAAGAQKVPLGVALYNGDFFGHDGWQFETIQNLTGNGQLNIVPLLDMAKSGTISSGVAPSNNLMTLQYSFSTTGLTAFLSNVQQFAPKAVTLKANDDVVKVLQTIDILMTVHNPLQVVTTDPNPLDWLGEAAYIVSLDFAAIIFRLLFIALGFYICFQVFNKITNFTTIAEKGIQTGVNVGKFAAGAAAL